MALIHSQVETRDKETCSPIKILFVHWQVGGPNRELTSWINRVKRPTQELESCILDPKRIICILMQKHAKVIQHVSVRPTQHSAAPMMDTVTSSYRSIMATPSIRTFRRVLNGIYCLGTLVHFI